MKQGIKTVFGSISMYPALDNPRVPGMKARNRKRRPFHFEAGNIPIRPNISIKNKYLLGTSWKMIKNYVEIFISGRRNIELLILTIKTEYFCSSVVLEGFEI